MEHEVVLIRRKTRFKMYLRDCLLYSYHTVISTGDSGTRTLNETGLCLIQ